MKKLLVLVILAFVTMTSHAQTVSVVSQDVDMYSIRPFNHKIGLTVYGSEYRKALTKRDIGRTVTFASPVLGTAMMMLTVSPERNPVTFWGGSVVAVGGLVAGIALWTTGRKELDIMLDDYSKRYAPGPHASASIGATSSGGFGLALNF